MKSSHRNVTVLVLALAGLAPPFARGAELAPDSPFLVRSGGSGAAAVSEGKSLELRGIMTGPDGTQYCIFDPQRGKSTWARLHETGLPFMVVAADGATDRVTLQTKDGRHLELSLRQAKIGTPEAKNYVAPAGPDYSKVSPEVALQQQRNEQLRDVMAQRRAEHLRAVKAGEIPAVAPAPPAPPPDL